MKVLDVICWLAFAALIFRTLWLALFPKSFFETGTLKELWLGAAGVLILFAVYYIPNLKKKKKRDPLGIRDENR